MQSNVIESASQIVEAKTLLYKYYVEDLKWEINEGNPSGLRIKEIDNRRLIVDEYDNVSTWFGVTQKKCVIACARLCGKDAQGFLEIERYSEARKKLKPILENTALNLIELSREGINLALSKNKKIFLLLLERIFKFSLENKNSIITTTNIKEWVDIYDRVFGKRQEELAFKYFESDSSHVEVYFAKYDEIHVICERINNLLEEEIGDVKTLSVSFG